MLVKTWRRSREVRASEAISPISSLSSERSAVLSETESLMKALEKYILHIQQKPSVATRHQGLTNSIHKIAQFFLSDVRILQDCLPLNAPPSLVQKVHFRLEKSRIKDVIQRLEQRKTSATLALEVIGRYVVG